ncbi:T-cell immunomodulatory protein-like [Ruditapes philippinarum]|uniref:T-cell immunomodulatory protein-like n=1 Tax=Ruditapes philippinarum TaxID=129788 RepID=UPI00295B0A8F|nr:T-cell immunomodulatory protein-like [Ruditapes philippinarum]
MTNLKIYLLLFVQYLNVSFVILLSDVTDKVFSKRPTGLIAAFGDFNADKYTDVFVISDNGKTLYVYLADIEEEFKETKLMTLEDSDLHISSVVPADFDGDLQMDVMVTLHKKGDSSYKVSPRIYWGQGSSLNTTTGGFLKLPDMTDQPLLMDKNADMIPDLFGEKSPGGRYFWIFRTDRNFTEEKQTVPTGQTTLASLRTPQSGAFVDLNNDLTADLCVVSKADSTQLEYWTNQNGDLTWKNTIPVTYEKELKVIGQFVFADFDGDLYTDVLVPACLDEKCAQSVLLVYTNKKWVKLPVDLSYSLRSWNFIPPNQSGAPDFLTVPITLRVGDFNLDGFPDLLGVVGNATGNLHRAVIMYNNQCPGDCGGFSRTFVIDWDTWLESHDHRALLPAFYDLRDNGILDIIVTSIDGKGAPTTEVREHKFVDDACFMKVMVVSGRCDYQCPAGRKPYGVNQPGPVVRYKTTDLSGDPQHKIAFQLSQSAYMPLQLPYSVFGLGQTPNFVDTLEVGIPTNTSKRLNHAWTSVIPNSQLLIIPHPINDPTKWTNKLFVTPSRLMMLTGAALLGTCGFIAGIVGVLHWRDKIEDKKEKRQEAQKFHFDAM